jgi:FMN-dependent NADH-azoreductase
MSEQAIADSAEFVEAWKPAHPADVVTVWDVDLNPVRQLIT